MMEQQSRKADSSAANAAAIRLTWWDSFGDKLRTAPDTLMQQLINYCREYNTSVASCAKGAWGKNESISLCAGKACRWVVRPHDEAVHVTRFRYKAPGTTKRQIFIAYDRTQCFNHGKPGIVVSLRCEHRIVDNEINARRSRWVLWTPKGLQQNHYIERLIAMPRILNFNCGLTVNLSPSQDPTLDSINDTLPSNDRPSEIQKNEGSSDGINHWAAPVNVDAQICLVIQENQNDRAPFRCSFSRCDSIGKLFAYAVRERKITTTDLMMKVKVGQNKSIIVIRDDAEDYEKLVTQIQALSDKEWLEVITTPLRFE